MYSGTTFTNASGRLLGAHQKIDRCAEKQLRQLIGAAEEFPTIRAILHFEGRNGPDAIKRKSPSKDEPWHYFQPNDESDINLIHIIESHYRRLVESLKQGDEVRQAFEAAWLAHAIVDGLTPAHHYPYGQKVVELRGGRSLESRSSIKKKLLLPGATFGKIIHNNWLFWGPKGLLTTHMAFEMGVATLIKPLSLGSETCIGDQFFIVTEGNLARWYRNTAKQVAAEDLYNLFYRKGWTPALAKAVKQDLFPIIVRTVALAWYGALRESNKLGTK